MAAPEAAGERRYLTVMFCDLVGSTGISAQLDAEEWRDLVGAYLDAASAAVTEMGGHVAKKLGDGLMALFGYPVAHENDAERAARAALAIQRALSELNRNGRRERRLRNRRWCQPMKRRRRRGRDAGDCGLAQNARHARVRGALCEERYRFYHPA
jgi:class 3 adenylate cyclase